MSRHWRDHNRERLYELATPREDRVLPGDSWLVAGVVGFVLGFILGSGLTWIFQLIFLSIRLP